MSVTHTQVNRASHIILPITTRHMSLGCNPKKLIDLICAFHGFALAQRYSLVDLSWVDMRLWSTLIVGIGIIHTQWGRKCVEEIHFMFEIWSTWQTKTAKYISLEILFLPSGSPTLESKVKTLNHEKGKRKKKWCTQNASIKYVGHKMTWNQFPMTLWK